MAPLFQVKTRFLLLAMLCWSGFAAGQQPPDAREILRSVRAAQTAQQATVNGRLRGGWKTPIPFKLTMAGNTVRWEFSDPAQTLQLRLGEKDAQFEEIGKGGAQRIGVARFDDKVRESDISYEDLSLKFLYWPKATVEGDATMLLQKCWIVRVEPPSAKASQYSQVKLWVTKNGGALMQAEAYGRDGKLERRFKVVSGQSLGDGLWMLKQMRIETMTGGSDKTPTYLEMEKPSS